MAKYGRSASKNVESAMRRRKRGTLKSGSGRRDCYSITMVPFSMFMPHANAICPRCGVNSITTG
jgi:Family of unknown function (DUF6496)